MTTPARQRSRLPHIRELIGFSVMIVLLFCVIIVYQGTRAYRLSVQEGNHDAVRLTRILSDHVELTFLGVDLSLRRAIERQYFNALFGNNLPKYTEQNFKLWLGETPQIVAMAMINEYGGVEVAAHKKGYDDWLDYHKTLLGQRLFEHMREADDTEIFIGRHYTEGGKSLILMSRRYQKIDGEFGGVVIAAINPRYFIDFYDSIATGKQEFMSLMLTDGSMLAQGPLDDISNEKLVNHWITQQKTWGDDAIYQLDHSYGSMKIVSLKKLKIMPIVAAVVLDEGDFLEPWRQSRIRDVGFLGLFVVFGSILSFLAIAMARQILRVEDSESAAILASQAKSEFLANMSHELRTPLNAIIGFSEMISSGYFGPLNPKQKERIHDINLCGSHLLQLITDILEFSKGEAGKLELLEEKVDMSELINESVRIMNGKIKTKNILLTVAIEPELPLLWADKRKIRQVLINLLSNAVKFTQENGEIVVSVKLDSHHSIVLSLSDTGIGIAEEDIPKALSVFGQVNRGKSHEGTGLGLPLCKMYAELHDGKLLLTSKIGQGTTVRIIFPHQRTLLGKTE